MSFVATYKGHKLSIWLSAFALVAGVVLSLVFAHERILNTDNSAFFFNLVNLEEVSVAEKRYSAGIPQFPALWAMQLGASLNVILHIFSASYTVLYLLIFGLILQVCKHKEAAIALALSLFFGVMHSFYHPVTETHQAIAWSILFYAFLGSNLSLVPKIIGLLFSFALALFAHPSAVFMLAFIMVWQLVTQRRFKDLWLYLGIAGLAVFAVLRSKLNAGNYDANQYQNLYASLGKLDQFFSWNSVKFLTGGLYLFGGPLLLWLAGLLFLLNKKQWLQVMVLLLAPLGLLVVVAATFSQGDSQMMMEKAYMPVWTLIAIGASFVFSSEGMIGVLGALFLFLFFMSSLIHINMSGNKAFKPRLRAMDKLIDELSKVEQQKFLSFQPDAPAVWKNNWWATAGDVLMRSTISKGKSITLYLALPEEHLSHAAEPQSFLYTNWWRDRNIDILNKRFFQFKEQAYDTIKIKDYEY